MQTQTGNYFSRENGTPLATAVRVQTHRVQVESHVRRRENPNRIDMTSPGRKTQRQQTTARNQRRKRPYNLTEAERAWRRQHDSVARLANAEDRPAGTNLQAAQWYNRRQFSVGHMMDRSKHYFAIKFPNETLQCCQNGKVSLNPLPTKEDLL